MKKPGCAGLQSRFFGLRGDFLGSTEASIGERLAPRAPTRSESRSVCAAAPLPSAFGRSNRVCACDFGRACSIAPLDYRDVPVRKAALPRSLAPQLVGARKTRRPYSADYVLRGSPTQCRQPRDRKPRKAVPRLTMVSEDRGRQPFIYLLRTRSKEGWRHWVGLLSPTSWGAYFVPAQALLWLAPLPSPLPPEGRVIGRGSFYRTCSTSFSIVTCPIDLVHLLSMSREFYCATCSQ